MLSICIPTFNRYLFLNWTIDRLQKDFPDAHVIVFDNVSDDQTISLYKAGNFYYYRQLENVGCFENMRSALLKAKSKYCVYCGDDDYLIPERIQAGIDFLETNPDVICYFAPHEFYDEVKRQAVAKMYNCPDGIFTSIFTSANQLWDFIINANVFPEHAIYRREGLEKILTLRSSAYWAFTDLANMWSMGPVAFSDVPFYRNITDHPLGAREQLGVKMCLTAFDEYRAGLECLAYEFFKRELCFDNVKNKIHFMIRKFITTRLAVAHRILTQQGRLDEAEVIFKRMMIGE